MLFAKDTAIAIIARHSNVDNHNWGQLVDADNIRVDNAEHLVWDGDGNSTRIVRIRHILNTVYVYTRSGAEYCIVFPLSSHGKAEWKEAQANAERLAERLRQEWNVAIYW